MRVYPGRMACCPAPPTALQGGGPRSAYNETDVNVASLLTAVAMWNGRQLLRTMHIPKALKLPSYDTWKPLGIPACAHPLHPLPITAVLCPSTYRSMYVDAQTVRLVFTPRRHQQHVPASAAPQVNSKWPRWVVEDLHHQRHGQKAAPDPCA